MMQDIKSVHDFDLVVTLNSGLGGYGPLMSGRVRQAKGVPLAMGVTACGPANPALLSIRADQGALDWSPVCS